MKETVSEGRIFFNIIGNLCFYLSFFVLAINLYALAEGEIVYNFIKLTIHEFIYGQSIIGFLMAITLLILNVLIVRNFMILNRKLTRPHEKIGDFERIDSIIYIFVYLVLFILFLLKM